MAGYLIGEEGPLANTILRLEEGQQWTIGRDRDEVDIVLEDLMVSRKHVICRLTQDGFVMENLSSVNPATQNGKIITDPVLLHEGDILQIGSTFFRFSEKIQPTASVQKVKTPEPTVDEPALLEEISDLSNVSVNNPAEMRWMMKVLTGPNTGAEFCMSRGKSYVMGKDPMVCDIILQDLSISRHHARISVDEKDEVFIEDLGSRNGTIVKGKPIAQKEKLEALDVVTLGTSSFLIIDRGQLSETVISEIPDVSLEKSNTPVSRGDWKKMLIEKKHLVWAAVMFCLFFVLCVGGVFLFQSEPVVVVVSHDHESARVAAIMKEYPYVRFTYYDKSGKLFLAGHVLSSIDKKELDYKLHSLSFLKNIEDHVVIDELVWTNINAMVVTKPAWAGVSISGSVPGEFNIRGYVKTSEEAQLLSEYLQTHFSYGNHLHNQVVVEADLYNQVQEILLKGGFNQIIFQLVDGEVVLSGRMGLEHELSWFNVVEELKRVAGIRVVKNYVSLLKEDASFVDLTDKYNIMGYSKKDGVNDFVVIDGKILTVGDVLDEEMVITKISSKEIFLERSGLKFKINCNLK